ncbi:MAG: hypothetical protein ACLFN2_05220 [Bacteroidales bacterium]
MKLFVRTLILFVFIQAAFFAANATAGSTAEEETTIEVFYKNQPPSMETLEKVKSFLSSYQNDFDIRYLDMEEPDNEAYMQSLGFPIEHFPFGIAINGKTSALIDEETIVFGNFPDFMHHIGRHEGNWTLDHLETVMLNPEKLLPDNPVFENVPGGEQEQQEEQEQQQEQGRR